MDWREGVRSVPFWRDARYKGLFHGFLGVDLAQPPGKHELKLNVQPESSDSVSCAVSVSVMAGKFPEEKLTVAPKYVEPNPEDAKRAAEEGERLRALFGTATPEKLWTGAFRLPLPGIHTAKNFGRRRVLNGTPGSSHSGVDIPAVEGTPIHASQRGRVVLAENLYFAGNTVVIDHGLGVYTLYGHMKVLGVQVGGNGYGGCRDWARGSDWTRNRAATALGTYCRRFAGERAQYCRAARKLVECLRRRPGCESSADPRRQLSNPAHRLRRRELAALLRRRSMMLSAIPLGSAREIRGPCL